MDGDNDEVTGVYAFGSCNKQETAQTHWTSIASHHPSHYFWIGDAVYPRKYTVESLKDAYRNLTSNPAYATFRNQVEIHGIWDDHDYGINDAGAIVDNKELRQKMFAGFINHPQQHSDGLYYSVDINTSPHAVRLIFLDTRSNRDYHIIPSAGGIKIPFSAYGSAFIRLLTSLVGLERHYTGRMLSESQWQWLEQSLMDPRDYTIVVSSVQVLTSNPVVESWGHFPEEKRRLLRLLSTVPNVVLLSGDVHHAEISKANVVSAFNNSTHMHPLYEVTSSGLTHSCGGSPLLSYVCPLMLNSFTKHRLKSNNSDNYYMLRNYGLIQTLGTNAFSLRMEISIHSLETNEVISKIVIPPLNSTSMNGRVVNDIQYAEFPMIFDIYEYGIGIGMAMAVTLFALLILLCRSKSSPDKKKKTK